MLTLLARLSQATIFFLAFSLIGLVAPSSHVVSEPVEQVKKSKLAKKSTAKKRITQLARSSTYTPMTVKQARLLAARGTRNPGPRKIKYVKGEPGTMKAYRSMMDKVSTATWGGGDVSISVRLGDGRRVWLFGDTLSSDRHIVHSTALVQNGRNLHVSNYGAQLLPNDAPGTDGTKNIYWIEAAAALKPKRYLVVTAAPIWHKDGAWNFGYRSKKSRQALIHVDSNNNARFVRWIGWVDRPDTGMDGEDFRSPSPGYYTYASFVHPIRLKSGQFLKTRNRNYDVIPRMSDGTIDYKKYRPLFQRSKTRKNPYWGR